MSGQDSTPTSALAPAASPKDSLRNYLKWLGIADDEPCELTAINPTQIRAKMAVAYGFGVDAVCQLVEKGDGAGPDWLGADGIYLQPALLVDGIWARYPSNAWQRCDTHSKDHEVQRRRVVYIDLDPDRIRGISSTNAEQQAAKAAATVVISGLCRLGVRDSIGVGMSGNGYQLHLRVDLPAESDTLVKRLLMAAKALWEGPAERWGHKIEVDDSVFNAAQICPAFGTLKRKGTDYREGPQTGWRPHRRSWFHPLVEVAKPLDSSALEVLIKGLIASMTDDQRLELERLEIDGEKRTPRQVSPKANTKSGPSDLDRAGEVSIRTVAQQLGLDPDKLECPWCRATTGVDLLDRKGSNTFKCQHQTCGSKSTGSVGLVAKVAFGLDDLKGDKVGTKNVVDWFVNAGLIEPSEKKGKKAAPTMAQLAAMAGLSEAEDALRVGIILDTDTDDSKFTLDDEPKGLVPTVPTSRRNLTDLGNAERLLDRHGDSIRYVTSWRKWIIWDGRQWGEDADSTAVGALANETVRAIYLEAQAEENLERRAEVTAWARRSEADKSLKAMVARATTLSALHVHHTQLDADPYALNMPNGLLDLKTGQLGPHERLAYCTKITKVNYNPKADRSVFDAAFAKSLPQSDVREFVLKLMGKGLTGDTRDHILPVHYGPRGRNGKGTFLGTLRYLLGDYSAEVPFEIFEQSSGSQHPTGLSLLFGKRFVLSSESGKGEAANVKLLKRLTGEDLVQTRKMGQDFWSFEPTHFLNAAVNYKMKANADKKDPFWERVALIEWAYIPAGERDLTLRDKLRAAHGEGMMAALVDACLLWQREGLVLPASVRVATEQYRDESDVLGDFIDEHLILDGGAKETLANIHAKYVEWSDGAGIQRPLARNGLQRELNEREIGQPGRDAQNRAVRAGVRIRTHADDPERLQRDGEAAKELDKAYSTGGIVVDDDDDEALSNDEWINLGVKH